MDPSNAQQQAMSSQSLEDVLGCPKPQQERRLRPTPEQALKCPRCDSTNTKFCYYNNYSLSQPRYFCKGCRRYWTKGGSLRNVPVGGGCRKNKRSSSSSSSSKRTQDQSFSTATNSNPLHSLHPLAYDSNHDLTLAFSRLHKQPTGHDQNSILGNPNTTHCDILGNPDTTTNANPGFIDALRSGFLDTSSNGFHNFYYGLGNGSLGNLEGSGATTCGGGGGGGGELVYPYEEIGGATIKQELCKGKDGENRILYGFPWQLSGDGNMGGLDSGRESWNGLGSSWHGLVNSPLM